MAENFTIIIPNLKQLDFTRNLPNDVLRSIRIATNYAATRGRTAMGREVLRQVNLPPDYVSPRNRRLYVSKQAKNNDLEAVITARARATSLAQFVNGRNGGEGNAPLSVEVHKGSVRRMPGAFLMKLKSGSQLTDTKFNMGLAVRTRSGRPPASYKPVRVSDNLYLLYGPSVSQIIASSTSGKGVADELTPDIQAMLEEEFWRQMGL